MLVGQLPYPEKADPSAYISPELCRTIQPTYDFIREQLAETLPRCKPANPMLDNPDGVWCLSDDLDTFLFYIRDGKRLRLNRSQVSGEFQARWFNPRSGEVAGGKLVEAGKQAEFQPPNAEDWVLYMQRSGP